MMRIRMSRKWRRKNRITQIKKGKVSQVQSTCLPRVSSSSEGEERIERRGKL